MKTLEHEPLAKEDARRMSQVQLARLGVELLNKSDLLLRCMECGETWTVHTDKHGKLFAGYWVCPKKCNL